NWMAAFTSREPTNRDAFTAHWARIRADEGTINRAIIYNGQLAGNIACFRDFGEPEVGYWIGRAFWGKGIATKALAAFLRQLPERPLYAHVATDNVASLRVLQKCGFTITGTDKEYSNARGQEVAEYSLILTASADDAPNLSEMKES
ncbi:MAG TPA: GNAT family N-acetyltransferase, partial [Ktedonobacterales bacterium]|nr:GNAT family N-acetyltransferase [Ktedonobacterales bacterium]